MNLPEVALTSLTKHQPKPLATSQYLEPYVSESSWLEDVDSP